MNRKFDFSLNKATIFMLCMYLAWKKGERHEQKENNGKHIQNKFCIYETRLAIVKNMMMATVEIGRNNREIIIFLTLQLNWKRIFILFKNDN